MTRWVCNSIVVAMVTAMLSGITMFAVTDNSWWLWLFVVPFIVFYAGG